MNAVAPLSALLDARQVWRGRAHEVPVGDQPTGWRALDAVLPAGGWPEASLSEILLPVDGVGELRLVLQHQTLDASLRIETAVETEDVNVLDHGGACFKRTRAGTPL